MNPNADIIAQARLNISEHQMPANARAIMRGEWDAGTLVQAEIARLLKEPPASEGEEV